MRAWTLIPALALFGLCGMAVNASAALDATLIDTVAAFILASDTR